MKTIGNFIFLEPNEMGKDFPFPHYRINIQEPNKDYPDCGISVNKLELKFKEAIPDNELKYTERLMKAIFSQRQAARIVKFMSSSDQKLPFVICSWKESISLAIAYAISSIYREGRDNSKLKASSINWFIVQTVLKEKYEGKHKEEVANE